MNEVKINEIFSEIFKERVSQNKKWGEQNHEPALWMNILMEEVGEAAKAVLESRSYETGEYFNVNQLQHLRNELIQTAAVTVAMIESLDRNELNWETLPNYIKDSMVDALESGGVIKYWCDGGECFCIGGANCSSSYEAFKILGMPLTKEIYDYWLQKYPKHE